MLRIRIIRARLAHRSNIGPGWAASCDADAVLSGAFSIGMTPPYHGRFSRPRCTKRSMTHHAGPGFDLSPSSPALPKSRRVAAGSVGFPLPPTCRRSDQPSPFLLLANRDCEGCNESGAFSSILRGVSSTLPKSSRDCWWKCRAEVPGRSLISLGRRRGAVSGSTLLARRATCERRRCFCLRRETHVRFVPAPLSYPREDVGFSLGLISRATQVRFLPRALELSHPPPARHLLDRA